MFSKIVIKVCGKEYLISCEDESKQRVYDIACKLNNKVMQLKHQLLATAKNKDSSFNVSNENLLLLESINLLDENIKLKKEINDLKSGSSVKENNASFEKPSTDLHQEIAGLEQEIDFLKEYILSKHQVK